MLSHFRCVSVQCCPWSMALKLLKLPFLCSVYCDWFKNTLRLKWEEGVSYTVSTQERTPSSSVNVSTREEVYVSVRCADGVKIQNCRKACSSSRLLKTRNTHLSCHRLLTEDALFLQQVWAEAVTHGGFYVFTLCSVTDGILLHDPSQCECELTLQFYTFISIFLQFFFFCVFVSFKNDLRGISWRCVRDEEVLLWFIASSVYSFLVNYCYGLKETIRNICWYYRLIVFCFHTFECCSPPRITNCDTKPWLTGALRGKLHQVNVPAGE